MSKNGLKLIIFFVPPKKIINGGIISIFSICEISRQFSDIHGSEVALSTYPGHPSYRKNDLFKNDEIVYSFDELVKKGNPDSLLLHIPEYASNEVFQNLKAYQKYLRAVPKLSINIMNQNILLMPEPTDTASWFSLTNNLTQTTAHKKYTTQALANEYNLPTHHFSAWIDPLQYRPIGYDKKEPIIILSPDIVEQKNKIIQSLKRSFPKYDLIVIKDMKFEKYKDLARRAKFCVTFGEGIDAYFIESFFSGGLAFAVYNNNFFPDKKFAGFDNIYNSYDEMLSKITSDMKRLDNKNDYEQVAAKNLAILTKIYDFSKYRENIKNYYLQHFTYLPQPKSAERLIGKLVDSQESIIAAKDSQLVEKDKVIAAKDEVIAAKDEVIAEHERTLLGIYNSKSWKITRPLRQATVIVKKKNS